MYASTRTKSIIRLVAAVVPLVCFATDNVFTGPGLWTETSLWSLGHIPTDSETAWITGAAALDSSQTTAGLNIQGTLNITGASTAFLSTSPVQIGVSGTNGILTQTGGSFETTSDFYVGEYRTGVVTFTDTDVTLAKFVVGHNGSGFGTYVQNGGSLLLNGSHVVMASGTSATRGTMSITDVSLTAVPDISVGYIDGTFYSTNSTIDCNKDFSVAPLVNSKGYAELTDSAIVDCVNIRLGSGTGARGGLYTFQSALTSDFVQVGFAAAATGVLTLDASSTMTASEFAVGYDGFGTVTNLSSLVEVPKVYVGRNSGSRGNLFVQEGSITASTEIDVGYSAGSYGQAYVTASDIISPKIYFGSGAGSTGTVTLADGFLSATNSGLYVADNGVGVFSNLAGTVRTTTLGISFSSGTAWGYLYCGTDAVIETSYVIQIGRWGTGTLDCYGTIHANSDTIGLFIGNLDDAQGTFNLYPGAELMVRNALVLGYTKGKGTFNQYGGTATVSNVLNLAGFNSTYSQTEGAYNLYGGTLFVNNHVYVGRYGTGVLHVVDGVMTHPSGSFYIGSGTTGVGECYLDGGRLETLQMQGNLGLSRLFFDGGTLAALANRSDFLHDVDQAEVRSGGAFFDTDGYTVTVAQSIAHDSREGADAKDGGLTKLGDGTLTMTGTLGFTGDLGADGGTLNLASATYSLASGAGLWGGGTLVPPSAGLTVPADGFVAPGGTNGVGTLTVDGDLTVSGQLRPRISADGSACGTLAVAGTLTFTDGSAIVIANPEAFVKGVNYTFASANAVSGTPAVANLPSTWVLKTDNNQLRAVYVSGTLISVR